MKCETCGQPPNGLPWLIAGTGHGLPSDCITALKGALQASEQARVRAVAIADALWLNWAAHGYCHLCGRTADFAGRHEKDCPLKGYEPTSKLPPEVREAEARVARLAWLLQVAYAAVTDESDHDYLLPDAWFAEVEALTKAAEEQRQEDTE